MRMKRRLAATAGRAPEELKTGNDWTEWREWRDLVRYTNAHSERERGGFLTLPQTAIYMGISPAAVRQLRKRGRLRGFKRNPARPGWWFFREEDVQALLADRQYAARRRRWAKSRQIS